MSHFNQSQKRKAEFITPPNTLKAKVGEGGLSDDILDKAEQILKERTDDFISIAELYLGSLMKGIEQARQAKAAEEHEKAISAILYPAMQIRANGAMFHYPIASETANKLIQFLEVVEKMDGESIDLTVAFYTTLRAVVSGKVTGDGGQRGKELIAALDSACHRYFEKRGKNPLQ